MFLDAFEETATQDLHLGKTVYTQIVRLHLFDMDVDVGVSHGIPDIDQVERYVLIAKKHYGFRRIPLALLNKDVEVLEVTSTSFTFKELSHWMDTALFLKIFYTKTS